jgi:hypothetical protein
MPTFDFKVLSILKFGVLNKPGFFMFEEYSKNKITNRLISSGVFSKQELKKIYREFCKNTHPDLTGKNSDEFLEIQNEYEEAKQQLNEILKYTSENKKINPREMVYKLLYNYNLSGLHTSKIRNKPALQERNLTILKELIFWASIYDPSFVKIFVEYNQKHIKDFNGWKEEEIFKKGRDSFIEGFCYFLEYQSNGKTGTAKVAATYLNESLFEIELITFSSLRQSIINFSMWLLKELELPPVYFKK